MSVFRNDVIIYIEIPKELEKLLNLIRESSMFARWKINILTSIVSFTPVVTKEKIKRN